MELPTEAGPPQEIEHRLVLHHIGRSDEHAHNDARLAAIDDIMIVIAQPGAPTLQAHWRGIRIRRARHQCGGALIPLMRWPLWIQACFVQQLPSGAVLLAKRCGGLEG